MDTVLHYIDQNKLTFEQAAANFSMDKDSRSNGGMMANPEDGTFKFQLSQIPAEIAKAIQNLQEGQISKPFTMIDERKGKETIRIVRLVKRHQPHKANINDDYDLLKTLVENQKRKQILDDWIRQKQKETYVVITPQWQGCDFQYKGWNQ